MSTACVLRPLPKQQLPSPSFWSLQHTASAGPRQLPISSLQHTASDRKLGEGLGTIEASSMLIRLVNNYCVDSLVACMRNLVLPDLAFWKALIITSQDYNIIHASMKYPNNNISLVIDPTLYIYVICKGRGLWDYYTIIENCLIVTDSEKRIILLQLALFPGSHAREREHWSCAGHAIHIRVPGSRAWERGYFTVPIYFPIWQHMYRKESKTLYSRYYSTTFGLRHSWRRDPILVSK